MLHLKLAAVGSSLLIAEEIADAVYSILGKDIAIDIHCIDEIGPEATADLYICATSQLKKLQTLLPSEKIVLLELIPTAKFFIAVARIPQGETIGIFNNYLNYAQILGEYCEKLGIGNVQFTPIAYKEMTESEITAQLSSIRYIIGVDKFIDAVLRKHPAYVNALREDVKILAATRVPSVPCACALLHRIAMQQHRYIARQMERICTAFASKTQSNHLLAQKADALLEYSSAAAELIQHAVIKSVVNHIAPPPSALAQDAQPTCATPPTEINTALQSITHLNERLALLAEKLGKIQINA